MGDRDEFLPAAVREEFLALDEYLASRQHERLVDLLTRWSTYTDTLFKREPVDFDDFRAMLGARDAIQALLNRATLPTKRVLEALVSHQDSMFVLGTTEKSGPDKTDVFGNQRTDWWWHRVPVSQGLDWTP
jgi:hypothetical protein